jgi:hypothetical protein|eukprot:COSAG01_NODE_979_length_12356_cov_224.025618_6_plen_87_part_00
MPVKVGESQSSVSMVSLISHLRCGSADEEKARAKKAEKARKLKAKKQARRQQQQQQQSARALGEDEDEDEAVLAQALEEKQVLLAR